MIRFVSIWAIVTIAASMIPPEVSLLTDALVGLLSTSVAFAIGWAIDRSVK